MPRRSLDGKEKALDVDFFFEAVATGRLMWAVAAGLG